MIHVSSYPGRPRLFGQNVCGLMGVSFDRFHDHLQNLYIGFESDISCKKSGRISSGSYLS